MHPDLIARTCGSIGVLGVLVYIGVLGTPKFIITPQQNFESVMLSIQVNDRPPETSAGIVPPPPEEEQVKEPEPEPEPAMVAHEPEPVKEQLPEPPPPEPPAPAEPPAPPPPPEKPAPVKQELKPKPEPQKPEPVKQPEPKKQQPVKQKPEPTKPKAEKQPERPAPVKPAPAREVPKAAGPVGSPPPAAADNAAQDEASARQINAQLASLLVKEIRSKLHYPRNAVRRKLEGTVMVEFIVKNGVVVNFNIEKSSGHRILDEAASKLARSLIRFNTRLDAMSNRVLIPIKYELL